MSVQQTAIDTTQCVHIDEQIKTLTLSGRHDDVADDKSDDYHHVHGDCAVDRSQWHEWRHVQQAGD